MGYVGSILFVAFIGILFRNTTKSDTKTFSFVIHICSKLELQNLGIFFVLLKDIFVVCDPRFHIFQLYLYIHDRLPIWLTNDRKDPYFILFIGNFGICIFLYLLIVNFRFVGLCQGVV